MTDPIRKGAVSCSRRPCCRRRGCLLDDELQFTLQGSAAAAGPGLELFNDRFV
jgi:hypothetical protein